MEGEVGELNGLRKKIKRYFNYLIVLVMYLLKNDFVIIKVLWKN